MATNTPTVDLDVYFFEHERVLAEKGDAAAQWSVGYRYERGKGVARDANEALNWYRKAAERGHALAQYEIATYYYEGNGVTQDFVEAAKWFRKAAEQGDPDAQYILGVFYDNGQGVGQNYTEAAKWFRNAAEQGHASAQFHLGNYYYTGDGVTKDSADAVKWFRKAAEQGHAKAQFNVGLCYAKGDGVTKDSGEAVKWYRKAAEQGHASAQSNLGYRYAYGYGVTKDYAEATKWYRKAAEQGNASAQFYLAVCYNAGDGVPRDYVEAYKWMNLASAQGYELAKKHLPDLEQQMSSEQIGEAQRLARAFKPRRAPESGASDLHEGILGSRPSGSGTGFLITEDGFLITNAHVVEDAAQVRLLTSAGFLAAKVVKVDAANDLALLKADGKFSPLPVAASRGVKLGNSVAMVGFPNVGLQGFAPKFARGEIAALSGARDDARFFQISVPVQPGNSGGALVDERGNVVGVVSAKLSAAAALKTSGALPENVNYAVKSSYLLGFLESVPDVAAKLKEVNMKERKFDDVVKDAEKAAVLVLVY